MKRRGTIQLCRDVFEHPVLRGDLACVGAWVWLIAGAAWARRKVTVDDCMLTLERGELAASIRFMSKKWNWTFSKVYRFLDRLEKYEMIERKTAPQTGGNEHGISIVRVINFDHWQGRATRITPGSPSGSQTGSPRASLSAEHIRASKGDDRASGSPNGSPPKRKPDQKHKQHTQERKNGARKRAECGVEIPPEGYAFEGRVIRLKQADYDRWRQANPDIENFDGTLAAADAYYTENPRPDGKWFFPTSKWLARENQQAKTQKRQAAYGSEWG